MTNADKTKCAVTFQRLLLLVGCSKSLQRKLDIQNTN